MKQGKVPQPNRRSTIRLTEMPVEDKNWCKNEVLDKVDLLAVSSRHKSDGGWYEKAAFGTYRTLSDSSCQQCPGNTRRDAEAASVCRCLDGFYRNDPPQEGPETGCTSEIYSPYM